MSCEDYCRRSSHRDCKWVPSKERYEPLKPDACILDGAPSKSSPVDGKPAQPTKVASNDDGLPSCTDYCRHHPCLQIKVKGGTKMQPPGGADGVCVFPADVKPAQPTKVASNDDDLPPCTDYCFRHPCLQKKVKTGITMEPPGGSDGVCIHTNGAPSKSPPSAGARKQAVAAKPAKPTKVASDNAGLPSCTEYCHHYPCHVKKVKGGTTMEPPEGPKGICMPESPSKSPPAAEARKPAFAAKPAPLLDQPCAMTVGGSGQGHACMFPFAYKGKTHKKCTLDDHHSAWCMTDAKGHWGHCTKECSCGTTEGGNGQAQKCTFPFKYAGKVYNGCTKDGHPDHLAWCATDDLGDSKEVHFWGHCTEECAHTAMHAEAKVPSCEEYCKHEKCIQKMTAKGVVMKPPPGNEAACHLGAEAHPAAEAEVPSCEEYCKHEKCIQKMTAGGVAMKPPPGNEAACRP